MPMHQQPMNNQATQVTQELPFLSSKSPRYPTSLRTASLESPHRINGTSQGSNSGNLWQMVGKTHFKPSKQRPLG